MMELSVGARLRSAVCETEVIVVAMPQAGSEDVRCGGQAMRPIDDAVARQPLDPGFADGTQIGKRYEHDSGLVLLCTKSGQGSLSIGDDPMVVAMPRKLPASD